MKYIKLRMKIGNMFYRQQPNQCAKTTEVIPHWRHASASPKQNVYYSSYTGSHTKLRNI